MKRLLVGFGSRVQTKPLSNETRPEPSAQGCPWPRTCAMMLPSPALLHPIWKGSCPLQETRSKKGRERAPESSCQPRGRARGRHTDAVTPSLPPGLWQDSSARGHTRLTSQLLPRSPVTPVSPRGPGQARGAAPATAAAPGLTGRAVGWLRAGGVPGGHAE